MGNPKELYIYINPNGIKSFFIKYYNKILKLKEFRDGIYGVVEARKEANKLIKELESGKNMDQIKGGDEKYIFKNLFSAYTLKLLAKGDTQDYVKRACRTNDKYFMPKLANKDVKDIKYSELYEICNSIFNPDNPTKSRLETLHRSIKHVENALQIAVKDRYLEYN